MAKKTAKKSAPSTGGSSRELRELQRENKRMAAALRRIEVLAGRITQEVKTAVAPTTPMR